MIFETLCASAKKDELILVDGGFCHWHLRRDGQLTIREIIVLPALRRRGIGTKMLEMLRLQSATSIFAKCPTDLEANNWYGKKGFKIEMTELTKSGRELNHWRLIL